MQTSELLALPENCEARKRRRFVRFFAANVSNPHTRLSYSHVCAAFMEWAEKLDIRLSEMMPAHMNQYILQLEKTRSAITVIEHKRGLRRVFDYFALTRLFGLGSPAFYSLLASFDSPTITDARDRALLAAIVWSHLPINCVAAIRACNFDGHRFCLPDIGKLSMSAHTVSYLNAYMDLAAIERKSDVFLFRQVTSHGTALSESPFSTPYVFGMIDQRLAIAKIAGWAGYAPMSAPRTDSFFANGCVPKPTDRSERSDVLKSTARRSA